MEPKLYCVSIPSSDLPLHVPVEWLIRSLVLCSMLLQVFLVFCGGCRYRTSSRVLRFLVWFAYMSADVVAISAVGIMTHSSQNQMYGVWAPLLLLHLGGPDTITAYSTADNELWIRHGLVLIYQVSVAAYVVYLSSLHGYLLASAILLFIAGVTKYGERTAALRYASYSQIVNSTQPVYKFMQHEDEIDNEIGQVDYNYLVMGEEQFERNLKVKQRKGAKVFGPRRYNWNRLWKKREENMQRYDSWNSLLKGGRIVTIKNVWYQEGLQTTDNYILCLSHALFKMYKRRFISLYFHEGIRPKTRRFFINDRLQCEKLFEIVERELKFMYDVLFTKSCGTAFGMMGTGLRILNTSLLFVAGILLYTGGNAKPAEKIVTYVVISVAIALEIFQLGRIAASDWTMVRVICAHIQHLRRPNRRWLFVLKLVRLAISVLGRVRKVCGNKYWKESITQYSVIDACSSKWSSLWSLFPCDFIVPILISVFHMREKPVDPNFKSFIYEKLKAACSPDQDVATCRERVYEYDEWLTTMDCKDLQWASDLDMEDLILTWHVATAICERRDAGSTAVLDTASPGSNEEDIRCSGIISRYCAYLLVSRPNLLPLHADIAKLSYLELHHELIPLLKEGHRKLEEYKSTTILGSGAQLARQLLSLSKEDRWKVLSGYWAGLLIYMAVYNKASFHAECLACGGEFISQIWVLLGHMGCGEQSDTAVSKKKGAKSRREKEEEYKKRRREEENSKEFQKIKRRVLGKNARKQEILKDKKEEERGVWREKERLKKTIEKQKSILR